MPKGILLVTAIAAVALTLGFVNFAWRSLIAEVLAANPDPSTSEMIAAGERVARAG